MVDYNNQTTVTTPPSDVLKISILERRAFFINSLEGYTKLLIRTSGRREDFQHLLSSLNSYYQEIRSAMKANKVDVIRIDNKILKLTNELGSLPEVKEVFFELEDFLYSKKLTQFDTKEQYNKFRLENSNRRAGY